MLRAVKIRLYPTKKQQEILGKHFGATRFIYNYMLDKKLKDYESGITSSAYDLKKLLPIMKKQEQYKWLKEIDSQSLSESVLDMGRAFKNFFRELKKSNKKGFPKFKSKYNSRQSYQYTQRVKINQDKNKVFLPKVGWVKAKIHRDITVIKTVTISKEADIYNASILTEFEDRKLHHNGKTIGLDIGVKHFAYLSNKKPIEPCDFSKDLHRVTILQKQLSSKQHSRFKGDQIKKSNNYLKQKLKLNKKWLKIANKRKDFLHKLSRKLSNYKAVIVEDLKIKNMTKSAKGNIETPGKGVAAKSGLNRSILMQAWGMFFKMLEYKLSETHGKLIKVDPRNTSRQCPECKHTLKQNRESQSVFKCRACGYTENADYVASLNIMARGTHDLIMPVVKSA